MTQHEFVRTEALHSVENLQKTYASYMVALKEVLDHGDEIVPILVDALVDKRANPIAKALGLMMHSPSAEKAFPRLLDWLVVQSPLYPDALEALVRAGDRVVPVLIERIESASSAGDDEAIRNLLDLGSRLDDGSVSAVVLKAIALLEHENPHIREAAADALWRVGLPSGLAATDKLAELRACDPSESVRKACGEALERLGGMTVTVS